MGAKSSMNVALFFVLALSSCLAALGQLFLKLGADQMARSSVWLNLQMIIGLGFYIAGLILWMYGLSRAPLYVVYPFALLTFVLVGLFAIIVLGERPAQIVILGWAIISVGVALVYYSSL